MSDVKALSTRRVSSSLGDPEFVSGKKTHGSETPKIGNQHGGYLDANVNDAFRRTLGPTDLATIGRNVANEWERKHGYRVALQVDNDKLCAYVVPFVGEEAKLKELMGGRAQVVFLSVCESLKKEVAISEFSKRIKLHLDRKDFAQAAVYINKMGEWGRKIGSMAVLLKMDEFVQELAAARTTRDAGSI